MEDKNMYNYTFSDNNNNNWRRIDKRQARRLYNSGDTIIIIADNMRPFTPWHNEIYINNADHTDEINDFNKRVMYFEVYNCINRDTGYHAAFYKMEV